MLHATRLLAEGLDTLHHQGRFRKNAEVFGQLGPRAGNILVSLRQISRTPLIRVRNVELLVLPHELEERRQIALEANLLADRFHLTAQPRHFLEAQLMDLVRCHRGRRHQLQHGVVVGCAIFQRADTL